MQCLSYNTWYVREFILLRKSMNIKAVVYIHQQEMMYPGMNPVNVDNAEKLSTVKQLTTA